MSWRNIRLIYAREIRDQLRDRRTLFMIAVLPLLLYPLIGMSVFQLSQFLQKNESKVLLLGSEQLTSNSDLPSLVLDGRFADELFDDPADAHRLILEFADSADHDQSHAAEFDLARQRLKSGEIDVVIHFPTDFGERLDELRAVIQKTETRTADDTLSVPKPEILYNSARERSRLARGFVDRVLGRWKVQVVRQNMLAGRMPINVAKPFELKPLDVAQRQQQEAAVWAKVLPFVLFVWALTGAFYPAVDLCAGEKERGTLETLLSSPALRGEIVWGKLLTVMTFSVATAALNLGSMGLTAQYVLHQLNSLAPGDLLDQFGLPSWSVIGYLALALVPISALFSALCLACAAFARSTKEGQYYLMPLLLLIMPLMILPMSPGVELNLGNSMIPVTGVVLLLRALVEGNYAGALPYVIPVCGVTLFCCLLAIRWAIYQFSQESVLFRESERLDLRRWIVHLVRDRQETPSLAAAFFCVALIFVIQFFTQLAISSHSPAEPDFGYLTQIIFISQVVCIALPALMMTLFLTERPLKTLLLDRLPHWTTCVAAIVLAVLLQPLGQHLLMWIQWLYPMQDNVLANAQQIAQMLNSAPNVWLPFLLLSVLPALCEEIAFRGFILSGLRHLGHKWWAICLTAVFFGLAHTVVQQSLAAAVLGLVIGYLAVQTGSLIPGMLFHATYNASMLLMASLSEHVDQWLERWPVLALFVTELEPGVYSFRLSAAIVCGVGGAAVLMWLHRMPVRATEEEKLSDARALQSQRPAVGQPFQADGSKTSG